MQRQPISVTALATYIKSVFDAESLLYNVEVIGEISGWSMSGRNAFFTIKDSNAMLNCVFFDFFQHDIPKNGDKVIVTGTPRYYVKGGKINLNVVDLKPYGQGEIFKRFLELKNRLEKEGIFDIAHKKAMPKEIKRIGVVTSETGAVIHDIINVANRRNSSQDIVLFPIKVQGIGADVEIARGIDFFSNYEGIDAVIVGRGGGSEEDLQCFNSEVVARSVYNCKKFIVSAVGHEVNFTLCDYACDLRAPTPSAAAELLTKDSGERRSELDLLFKSINGQMNNKLSNAQLGFESLCQRMSEYIDRFFERKEKEIEMIKVSVDKSDPMAILKLGYAKVECNGKPVSQANSLNAGENINVIMRDATVRAVIKEIDKNGL